MSVFEKFIDPCDIHLPQEVTGELLRCSTANGRISYDYLLAIYRAGVSAGRAASAELVGPTKQAHAETLLVFASVDGSTSPREAAKQAADYMFESLLAWTPPPRQSLRSSPMIQIQKSQTADTRTCDFANVSKETLLASSKQHIGDVRLALALDQKLLREAAAALSAEAAPPAPTPDTRCVVCADTTMPCMQMHAGRLLAAPAPTGAPADLSAIRHAWEAGFALCRNYGDNHAHFDGEQKERQWKRYLFRGHPAAPALPPDADSGQCPACGERDGQHGEWCQR